MKIAVSFTEYGLIKLETTHEMFDKFFIERIIEKGGEARYLIHSHDPIKDLKEANIIFHNPRCSKEYFSELPFIYLLSDEYVSESLDDCIKAYRISKASIKNFSSKTRQLCPDKKDDVSNKRSAISIFNKMGVSTPKTFLAEEFDKDGGTYPVYVKHETEEACRDTHFVKDKFELEDIISGKENEYIVQEPVDVLTFCASHLRVLTFMGRFIGSTICYNPLELQIDNKKNSCFRQIALSGRNWRIKPNYLDEMILEWYNATKPQGVSIKIIRDALKIAQDAKKRGLQLIAMDFVVDNSYQHYCIDVNKKPGLGMIISLYGKGEFYHPLQVPAFAATTLADKFMKW